MTTSAYDLANRIKSEKGDVSFGTDREKAASFLRLLADKIESGSAILQNGNVYTAAHFEDYTMTALVLKFHERHEKAISA